MLAANKQNTYLDPASTSLNQKNEPMRTTTPQLGTSMYGPLMDNGSGGGNEDPKDPNNGDPGENGNGDTNNG